MTPSLKVLLRVYSLEDIYSLAESDKYSVRLDGYGTEGFLLYGVKIVRSDRGRIITIYNTMRHGEYYDEISDSQYDMFTLDGWRIGVYRVAIDNYKDKIEVLSEKIDCDFKDRPSYTASLQSQLKSTENKLKKIEQKLWKAIHTKPSAQ